MTILCIETSTSVCSVAICRDGVVSEQLISREGGNHAKLLPVFIDQLLNHTNDLSRLASDISPTIARQAANGSTTANPAIDAVALSEGPGSYTGLRIGTSTAKGLCYGLNVPLVAVPTLQILSAAALAQSAISNQLSPILLCPMIDARRMEVYTALYGTDLTRLSEVKAVVVDGKASLPMTNNPSPLTNPLYYFGDGAAKCQAVLTAPECQYIPDIVPEAQYMGALAEQLLANGKGFSGNDLAYYEPFYLKEFVAAQSHVKGLL